MKSNIIRAIINFIKNPEVKLAEYSQGRNRINNVGEALERYIKDLFAGIISEVDENKRIETYSQIFSYLGNQNNPPDAIIKNGDALEIKKIESLKSALALNSSYPKAKLFANSPMITKECRNCELWEEKDIIYAVGFVEKKSVLKHLCLFYGNDYAASEITYTQISKIIKDGITSINSVEFTETKELGRVNRVDPLGITNLRIRGMWHIDNPINVFDYIYQPESNNKFSLMALINEEKYFSFSDNDRDALEELGQTNSNLLIKNVKIKIPDNPAKLKNAKLITFVI